MKKSKIALTFLLLALAAVAFAQDKPSLRLVYSSSIAGEYLPCG